MKHVLIALFALTSSTAIACPNLSGRFECKDFDTGAVQDVVMTQNGTTFTMTITSEGETVSSDYIADGVLRTVERPTYVTRTEKAYCTGDALIKEIKGVLKEGNVALDAVVTVKLTRDGHMYDSYVGQQGDKAINFEETCARVN